MMRVQGPAGFAGPRMPIASSARNEAGAWALVAGLALVRRSTGPGAPVKMPPTGSVAVMSVPKVSTPGPNLLLLTGAGGKLPVASAAVVLPAGSSSWKRNRGVWDWISAVSGSGRVCWDSRARASTPEGWTTP
jgi:hypothetical protein